MLASILGAVLAVAVLLPDTPLGKMIRELLIDGPARKLKTFRRPHWVAVAAAIAMMAAFVVYAKTEGMMIFAGGLPEAICWFAFFDIATYIDVIALLALLAATVRFRAAYLALQSAALAAWRWVLTRLRGLGSPRHARARRRRPTRCLGRGRSNDEEERWRLSALSLA